MADPASFSNLEQTQVKSFHLELQVDFSDEILKGYIDIKADLLQESTELVLDTRDLVISQVEDSKGNALKYKLDKPHATFGSRLVASLPEGLKKGDTADIRIHYKTSPKSSAIQWLPPSNTAGKKHPYLFTQCQAIHARSMFPCQDSPGVKSTYTANVKVPSPLTALMSAQRGDSKKDQGTTTFSFNQPVPTPSYLVALVVGFLEERPIGPRSSVWSEPEMVDAGASEFADTEKYLKAAENVAGPYVWGRYDILLLPPSFPYGGMENPCLTFVTPTLLAGDKSLATVVIHEIAHSWMGNLVTCKTWVDFWMNEGFCRFLELKVIKALFGEKHFDLYACIGLKDLRESVKRYGDTHNYTKMRPDLKGVDPDDAFSSVPYEKGLNFLIYLEGLVGGDKAMNPFLKAYCDKFKYKAITAEIFRDFFLDYFKPKTDSKVLGGIEWNKWWDTPGMPYKPNKLDTSLVDASTEAAQQCMEGKAVDASLVKKWSTSQTVLFLDRLEDLEVGTLEKAKKGGSEEKTAKAVAGILQGLDNACEFSKSNNSEIKFRWYKVCIRVGMESVFPATVKFITEQGRMKYVRPLYRLLSNSKKGEKVALEAFQAHRHVYHAIAAKMLAKDLKLA